MYSPMPIEMSTWSTPFFLLSKKMAPLRLTRRSAFSCKPISLPPSFHQPIQKLCYNISLLPPVANISKFCIFRHCKHLDFSSYCILKGFTFRCALWYFLICTFRSAFWSCFGRSVKLSKLCAILQRGNFNSLSFNQQRKIIYSSNQEKEKKILEKKNL